MPCVLEIFTAVIFSRKGERKETSRRIQRAVPCHYAQPAEREDAADSTSHGFVSDRREEEVLVGGIQSLEPGSGDGSFDSVGKELVYIFAVPIGQCPPRTPCDKNTSRGPVGGDLCPTRHPGSVVRPRTFSLKKNGFTDFPLNARHFVQHGRAAVETDASVRQGRKLPLDGLRSLCDVTHPPPPSDPPPLAVW